MDKEEYISQKIDELFLNMILISMPTLKALGLIKEYYDIDSFTNLLNHYLSNDLNTAYLAYFEEARASLIEIAEAMYFESNNQNDASRIRKSLRKCINNMVSLEINKPNDSLGKLLQYRILPNKRININEFLKKCYANDFIVALKLNGFKLKEFIGNPTNEEKIMSLVFYLKSVFFVRSINTADTFIRNLLINPDLSNKEAIEFILSNYAKTRLLNGYDKDFSLLLFDLDTKTLNNRNKTNVLIMNNGRRL